MQTNEKELKFYNSHFGEINDISLIKKFVFDFKTKTFRGKIILKRKKNDIEFDVLIPEDYPLRNMKFICLTLTGYPHQNYDDSICLNTPFVNHIYSRIELEIEKLRGWVSRYLEEEQPDKYYEYVPAIFNGEVNFLFQEGEYDPKRFEQSTFGEMQYSVLNYINVDNNVKNLTAFCQIIGNKETEWSSNYKQKLKFFGIWVYINQEPVKDRKKRIDTWSDLVPLLPEGFLNYFKDFCKKNASYKLGMKTFQNKILLCIGYRIPLHENKEEVNWDLIVLPKNIFPRKFKSLSYSLEKMNFKIIWEQTYNSDYRRFFGRGAFSPKITNSKILILGVGALGSSLAEILVRGGLKHLTINDFDIVEPGNICRSTYAFADIGGQKVEQLCNKLMKISPFVEIEVINGITPSSSKSKEYELIKSDLGKFDIIFDCAANNRLLQMLSDMSLLSSVYYLSITDKAKEMLCITNNDCQSMIERKNQMLFSLDSIKEAGFREGTGCWHPTFEASYFDINQLLNYTIKKINLSFTLNLPKKSFYSYFRNELISCSQDIKFVQNELRLTISIESACLDKIFDFVLLHSPNEFGGIFVGNYINNYKEVIISDVIIPRKFKNSTTSFQPDPNDLNNQLRNVYEKHGNRIVYIGDWHSHPNSNNQYSKPDLQSIKTVAKSLNVNTHNPILMIAAFGKDYFDPGFYVYFNDKLFKYERVK